MKKLTLSVCLLFLISQSTSVLSSTSSQSDDSWSQNQVLSAMWDHKILNDLQKRIEQKEFKKITSVLVAHKGQLVYEQYFNNGHKNYLNDLRSATKSITSNAVGLLVDAGNLPSLKARVESFFSDKKPFANSDPRKTNITLKDLITMSSMLECNDDNSFSRGNEERMYIYNDWVKFVLDLPVKGYAPWEMKPEDSSFIRSFSYCTAGSFLLGAVVEKASGISMQKLLADKLDKPMGIKNVKWNYSPHGITSGAGGTRYRSRDFLKFGQLILNKGSWKGEQLLSEAWINEATAAHVSVRDGANYGYLWWRFEYPLRDKKVWSIAATGNGGNYLFVLPEEELTVLITSEAYNTRYMHKQSQAIYRDYILKALPQN